MSATSPLKLGGASPCAYWNLPQDASCLSPADYLLELVSREGLRCETFLCREHVHKAWDFGQRTLEQHFPERILKLSGIHLTQLVETLKKRVDRFNLELRDQIDRLP